jgi:hypothetical protein
MRRRAAPIALAVLVSSAYFAVVAWTTPSASASIKVTSNDGDRVVSFRKVQCRRFKGTGFSATATVRQWQLTVGMIQFHGFRTHEFRYGPRLPEPIAEIEDLSRKEDAGHNDWSNIFSPDQLRRKVAGKITFPKFPKKGRGKKQHGFGIKFPFAYTPSIELPPPDYDLTTMEISGSAPCVWRKPKPRS